MRIATYNVEWFTALFDEENRLLADEGWSRRHNVTREAQVAALGTVFRAMDADAVMVIEAPDEGSHRSTRAALEGFAAHHGLRTTRALSGFASDTQQEIALLYDPAKLSAEHSPSDLGAPRFDTEFALDLDVDALPDPVRWSKPPLELTVTPVQGAPFRIIGVHAKSKAPHGARSPEDATRIAIANRRKQLAQCIWLRRRVSAHLADGAPLVVLGDFNDGPGLDVYERLFGRSGVEIVLGEGPEAPLYDPHAAEALERRLGTRPSTARFFRKDTNRYLAALLDYIMVSEDLRARAEGWRILHPFDDPDCFDDADLQQALLAASDHFPVVCDVDLS
ncbi:MAG: endonuclease/exonuclease/phosphatase family protein [Pseudomonadota bacterium]